MPLNPTDKMESPKTFQYDEDAARDWEAFVKYCPRKLNVRGKVDPRGGLVDITMKTGVMTNPSVTMYQFRPRLIGDEFEYPKLRPLAYDGERWLPVGEYVQSQKCNWCMTDPPLGDRVAGHFGDRASETHHNGKFPPNAYGDSSPGFDPYRLGY